MSAATCTACGASIVARGPEPAAGRYCMRPDCQRERYRVQNRLRGEPKPPRPCTECGSAIPIGSHAGTCSEGCATDRRRRIQRDSKRRTAAAIPGYYQAIHTARLTRAAIDSDYAARLAEWEGHSAARKRADPEYREQQRAYHRALYARQAALIQEKRRAKLDAMTPEDRDRWLDRVRSYSRKSAAAHRVELRADPERHAAYLARLVEYRRQRALRDLLATAAQLQRRAEP